MAIHIKNIVFSFLTLSLFLFKSYACRATSIENKEKIIASLYEASLGLRILNPQAKALYIQTLQEHKVILKHIITNESAFFNNAEIIKGIIGLWFGLPWFFKCIQPFFIYLCLADKEIYKEGIERPIGGRYFALFISTIIAAVPLWIVKLSFNSLYQGWYKKEKVIKDLAKTNELLIMLTSV